MDRSCNLSKKQIELQTWCKALNSTPKQLQEMPNEELVLQTEKFKTRLRLNIAKKLIVYQREQFQYTKINSNERSSGGKDDDNIFGNIMVRNEEVTSKSNEDLLKSSSSKTSKTRINLKSENSHNNFNEVRSELTNRLGGGADQDIWNALCQLANDVEELYENSPSQTSDECGGDNIDTDVGIWGILSRIANDVIEMNESSCSTSVEQDRSPTVQTCCPPTANNPKRQYPVVSHSVGQASNPPCDRCGANKNFKRTTGQTVSPRTCSNAKRPGSVVPHEVREASNLPCNRCNEYNDNFALENSEVCTDSTGIDATFDTLTNNPSNLDSYCHESSNDVGPIKISETRDQRRIQKTFDSHSRTASVQSYNTSNINSNNNLNCSCDVVQSRTPLTKPNRQCLDDVNQAPNVLHNNRQAQFCFRCPDQYRDGFYKANQGESPVSKNGNIKITRCGDASNRTLSIEENGQRLCLNRALDEEGKVMYKIYGYFQKDKSQDNC